MKKILLILIGILAVTEPAEAAERMRLTCYTPQSCPGTHTATGAKVREGIIACNTHIGDCAIIYTVSGDFIGYYECLDAGGSKGLKEGTQIDMWMPDMDSAWDMVHRCATGKYAEVDVVWVEEVDG